MERGGKETCYSIQEERLEHSVNGAAIPVDSYPEEVSSPEELDELLKEGILDILEENPTETIERTKDPLEVEHVPSDNLEDELIETLLALDNLPLGSPSLEEENVYPQKEETSSPREKGKEKENELYTIVYQCSCCQQFYPSQVNENPWFQIVRHECPYCHREQYPFIDINLPSNARELDPNLLSFYQQMDDDDFLDLSLVDNAEEFSLELSEPVLHLILPHYRQRQQQLQHQASQRQHASSSSPRLLDSPRSRSRVSTPRRPEVSPRGTLLSPRSPEPQSTSSIVQTIFDQNFLDSIDLRLIAVVTHAVNCKTASHFNPKHATLCHNAKILLLHMGKCKDLYCLFPCCAKCRPILGYLSCFPDEETVSPSPRRSLSTHNLSKKTSND